MPSASLTSIDVVGRCVDKIRGRGLRVVFPEGNDERIVAAAKRLREEKIAEPIVLGVLGDIEASDRLEAYAALYVQGRPDSNSRIARRIAAKPLFHAGLMLKAGDADAMLAGVAHPTARVIEAGMMTVGLAEGVATPSARPTVIMPASITRAVGCATPASIASASPALSISPA